MEDKLSVAEIIELARAEDLSGKRIRSLLFKHGHDPAENGLAVTFELCSSSENKADRVSRGPRAIHNGKVVYGAQY